MLLPGENSPKSWFFITILVSTIIAFSESSEGKTLDIKLGFDLTQVGIGGPSLRIRDFEDSRQYNPRALDGESSIDESASEKKIAKLSSEEQAGPKKDESSKENLKPQDKSDEDVADDEDKISASGEDNTVRITRGPKTGDFDPEEENPKLHGNKYGKDSDSEKNSEEDARRFKRHIDRFGNVVKRK